MLTEGKTKGSMSPKKHKNNKRPTQPPPSRGSKTIQIPEINIDLIEDKLTARCSLCLINDVEFTKYNLTFTFIDTEKNHKPIYVRDFPHIQIPICSKCNEEYDIKNKTDTFHDFTKKTNELYDDFIFNLKRTNSGE